MLIALSTLDENALNDDVVTSELVFMLPAFNANDDVNAYEALVTVPITLEAVINDAVAANDAEVANELLTALDALIANEAVPDMVPTLVILLPPKFKDPDNGDCGVNNKYLASFAA